MHTAPLTIWIATRMVPQAVGGGIQKMAAPKTKPALKKEKVGGEEKKHKLKKKKKKKKKKANAR